MPLLRVRSSEERFFWQHRVDRKGVTYAMPIHE